MPFLNNNCLMVLNGLPRGQSCFVKLATGSFSGNIFQHLNYDGCVIYGAVLQNRHGQTDDRGRESRVAMLLSGTQCTR